MTETRGERAKKTHWWIVEAQPQCAPLVAVQIARVIHVQLRKRVLEGHIIALVDEEVKVRKGKLHVVRGAKRVRAGGVPLRAKRGNQALQHRQLQHVALTDARVM